MDAGVRLYPDAAPRAALVRLAEERLREVEQDPRAGTPLAGVLPVFGGTDGRTVTSQMVAEARDDD